MQSSSCTESTDFQGAAENRPDPRIFPPGSCDTHFHVFGNAGEFPCIADRSYTPEPATMADYWRIFRPLGIDRCVLVQPSVYGRDHRLLEQTLRQAPADSMRGVAVVHEDMADAEIERLHRLGVRGARCNALFQGGVPVARLQAIVDRIRAFGWHLQMLVDVDDDPGLLVRVAAMGVPVVADHFGHPSHYEGGGGAGLRNLQALMREGRAWVKFSGAYRISRTASAIDPAVLPMAHALLQANPQRVLWGSDWPHPGIQAHSNSAIELAQVAFEWIPAQFRHMVWVENPARLYWGY